MNKKEAVKILEDKLSEYRKLSYSEILKKIGKQETFQGGNKEEDYQIEVDFFFDDEEGKTLRVTAMVSYNFWTDFSPITSDFIVARDGTFIGE